MPAAAINVRPNKNRVVFDGQSLNVLPAFPNNYPTQLMTGRGVPYKVTAISGISWTILAQSAAARTYPWSLTGESAVLVMCGGTTDLAQPGDMDGGEANTGAQAYADMQTYATAARAVGFDRIIALTVTVSDAFLRTLTNGPSEIERQNLNTLIRANTAGFEGIVDVANRTELMDCTNATYYEQLYKTHWTTAGAAVVASMVGPVLLPMLPGG